MRKIFTTKQFADKLIVNVQVLNCDAFFVPQVESAVKAAILQQLFNISEIKTPFTNLSFLSKQALTGNIKLVSNSNRVLCSIELGANLRQFLLNRGFHKILEDFGSPNATFGGKLAISIICRVGTKGLTKNSEFYMHITHNPLILTSKGGKVNE